MSQRQCSFTRSVTSKVLGGFLPGAERGEHAAYVQHQLGHPSIKLMVETYAAGSPDGEQGRGGPLGTKLSKGRKTRSVARWQQSAPDRDHPARKLQMMLVRPGRFERPTYRFVVCCSIQLS